MLKFPDDVKKILKRKFQRNHKEWLKSGIYFNTPEFEQFGLWETIEINLEIPTEKEAIKQTDVVQLWIKAWKLWQGGGQVKWAERNWQTLGVQKLPEKLLFNSPDDVVSTIGETERWRHFINRFRLLIQRWPKLIETLPRHYNVITNYSESDFLCLCETLSWLSKNPVSNLYIRQIPVTGVNSKWLESHKNIVADLIALINDNNEKNFYKQCGLKPLPKLIRIRILDQKIRNKAGNLCDISAPLEEIAVLDISPAYVFIAENIQTGLAFNDLPDSVVIMGLGYGTDVMETIQWIKNAKCFYWGDIDTHGFAILNRTRSYIPKLDSILMNESILLKYRELWVKEEDQHAAAELPLLTEPEQKLYQSLKKNTFGQKVRLEQEKINWEEAWGVIRNFLELRGIAFQSQTSCLLLPGRLRR
jgi:hypothetical protein